MTFTWPVGAFVYDETVKQSGSLVIRPNTRFDSVKVFSATMVADRDRLGEKVTEWMEREPVDVVEFVVTQSSDAQFHCIAITVFYRRR